MTTLRTSRIRLATAIIVLAALVAHAAARDDVRREVHFPDLPGYETLVCDLHMHTVFSDGDVWPPVRVEEAWRQGLDAIALSDHVEYQPHRKDLPTNHNRPHELAENLALINNLLLIRGAEITRPTPPGHFNAIFLRDVDALVQDDFLAVVEEANRQEAFVFWNHPGYETEGKSPWRDVHTRIFEKKWLHGIEVANGDRYYPAAHRWCLEKNLTMMGNSDIHPPDARTASRPGNHRTATLVFAKERTVPALKEALFAGRTAVWHQDKLIGRREWLAPLFERSVRVRQPHLRRADALWVEIENRSDMNIALARTGKVGPHGLTLPARAVALVKILSNRPEEPITLEYTATNFWIEPEKGLPVTLCIPGQEAQP
ncbi:MAG: hypothetical protein JW809_06975 [Pirellulales bacterium]|nr:hypothetical protein [Pirellulales bacterium]